MSLADGTAGLAGRCPVDDNAQRQEVGCRPDAIRPAVAARCRGTVRRRSGRRRPPRPESFFPVNPAESPAMPASLSSDVRDLLALTLVPGIGPRLTTALLERFGTIDRVMRATAEQLAGVPRVGTELAARIAAAAGAPDADAEAERVAKAGVQLLVLG